jgi:hypothetical protein
MAKVIDLSDLVQAVEFKFSEQEFNIPPIPDDKLTEIMDTAQKITKAGEAGAENQMMNQEFLDNQNHFLALAVQRKEGKSYKKMEEDEFKSWPMKLKNRVMELVFEQIGTSSGEAIEPESEKN